jgi:hypothetical protein
MPLDRLAQLPVVLGEDVRVSLAQLLEQAGRSLDIGNEQRDGPVGSALTARG